MLDLRDLQFLTALARHKHFARAAADCGVSQPAFSMRIRNLEERLKTKIVKRGNRFQGLTTEGETILRHARKILDDVRVLEQEFRSATGEITGPLTLGVVPTAAAFAAQLTIRLHHVAPGIKVRIDTATSLAIQQGVEDGKFDAGVTYTDGASRDLMIVEPLYDERYVLLAPEGMAPRKAGEISWKDTADLSLCLLEPGMQNRRILDRAFEDAGVQPRVIAETNGLTAAVVMAVEGLAATVVPEVMIASLGPFDGTVVLPIVDPVLEKSVCLVSPQRSPGLPTLEALRQVIQLGLDK